MRTTYSNTRHPKFAKYFVIAGIILSFVCFALYATIDEEADTITSSEQKKYPMKISKKNADLIVAQLTKVNPSIEIKHVNYI